MSLSLIKNLSKTSSTSQFEASNYYTYGCGIDGLYIYNEHSPQKVAFDKVIFHPHEDGWFYKYIGILPGNAGWVMWDPWYPVQPKSIMRINPHRAQLTLDELEQLVYRVLPFGQRQMARVECKLDLCGWDTKSVAQCLWAPRLAPREYVGEKSTTYYFGKNRRNGQVKVYDKGVERGWDLPDDLTRIEKVYAWEPEERVPFSQSTLVEAMRSLRPFHNLHFIDFRDVKGSERLGRLLDAGMTFSEILRCTSEKYGVAKAGTLRNKMVKYAHEHLLFDLAAVFEEQFTKWINGNMPKPVYQQVQGDILKEAKDIEEALREDGELVAA